MLRFYLVRFGEGRCTRAEAAALLAFALELGLRRTLLAILPTRFEVMSFEGIMMLISRVKTSLTVPHPAKGD